MSKMKYEKPNFKFEEMRLMERIADKCWGYEYAFVDGNMNGVIELPGEKYHFPKNGCEGNNPDSLDIRLKDLIAKFPLLEGHIDNDDVATNIQNASPWIQPPVKS